jgi:fucose 4-O-acetylase-like acetyltransferase
MTMAKQVSKISPTTSYAIEWLRFAFAVAIVFYHAFGEPMIGMDSVSYNKGLYDIIRLSISRGVCEVAVPFFFLISGFLFYMKLEEWNFSVWKGKIEKRIRTLLIPYLLWNLITFLYQIGGRLIVRGRYNCNWIEEIGGMGIFWDTGNGYPHNIPLWFLRNLIVLVALSPLIFYYIRKLKLLGIVVLYILFLSDMWMNVAGLEIVGFFYFSMGAYFSINRKPIECFFNKYWQLCILISIPLLIVMVLTYGDRPILYPYIKRLFTPLGLIGLFGFSIYMFQLEKLKVNIKLSRSTFFIYAAHGTIVLPIIRSLFDRIIQGHSQLFLIVKYFSAPIVSVILLVWLYSLLNKFSPQLLSVLTGERD